MFPDTTHDEILGSLKGILNSIHLRKQ